MAEKPTLDMSTEHNESPSVDTWFTFGTQYGDPARGKERHPVFDWISGDGYVRITAPSREAARALAFAIFGAAWAFDYDRVPGSASAYRNMYPDGELAHITLSLDVTPARLRRAFNSDITQVEVDGVVVAETRRIDLT